MPVFQNSPRPRFWGVQYHLLNLDPGLIVGTVPNSLASLRGLVRRKDVNPGTLMPGGVDLHVHPDSPIKKMDFFLRQGTFYVPFS